ncbi:MAG: hypothetical protein N3E47_02080, partial [Candidatus Bathyarchaeota archaeon]|nr:hypothetical protein [Candidatus Bathyarchaeota archaeon]
MLRSRKIALIAVFTALTVSLNLFSPIRIPAPYAPFLIYQVWEVPIVAAFLLYGFSVGALISVVNTLVLLAVFPGALLAGPFYNLSAIVSMLLGLFSGMSAIKSMDRGIQGYRVKSTLVLTACGILFRAAIM